MTADPPGSKPPKPALSPRQLPQRYAAVRTVTPLARRVATWFDQRTGYSTLVKLIADQPIPGGARWWYVSGGILTFLLGLQFLTGMLLASAYAPSVTTAWASTAFIQDTLTLGWFIRGLHSFGSTAMIGLAIIHLLQALIYGAYKAPREINWLVGLVILGLLVAFAVTGYGLPWDERGYWANQVETSTVGTIPWVGPWLQAFLQGGNAYGNYTVTRFYAIHSYLLPAAVIGLLVIHIALARRHGVTPRWGQDEATLARTTQSYWPHQALRDTTACGVTFVLLAMVVIKTHGAALEAPVDPTGSYQARPEWYALAVFQLRKYFGGSLEMIATMVIPGLAALALAALPWWDRAPTRDPARRKRVFAAALFGAVALAVLSYVPVRDDRADPAFQRFRGTVMERAARARQLARAGVPPEGGLAVFRNDPSFEARELWEQHCANCHSFSANEPNEPTPVTGAADHPRPDESRHGPNLHGYNSRAWIQRFLRNPLSPLVMGRAQIKDGMKPVAGSDDEIRALTELVYAETGASDVNGSLREQGEALFSDKDCDSCHDRDGTSENSGPNLKGRGTLDYVVAVIADASDRRLYGDKNRMPRFAERLSPDQIADLARFVLAESAKVTSP